MKIELREDPDPDVNFYYDLQFRIYREPYLIWDRDTWGAVLANCRVYQVKIDGDYAGDVILEERRRGADYIVDFSILPEYQRRGIGRAVLEILRTSGRKLTAVTRKETLPFFLENGFTLTRRIRNYYDRGVDGYDVACSATPASTCSVDPR